MRISRFVIILSTASLLLAAAHPALAGVLSSSKVKITQLRIIHSGPSMAAGELARPGSAYGGAKDRQGLAGKTYTGLNQPSQPSAWGVYSDYIGPGDINRLISVELYLDTYNRISAVKVTRESYTGDMVVSIFTGVVEFSIQTLKPGSDRPSKETEVIIRTADSLSIP